MGNPHLNTAKIRGIILSMNELPTVNNLIFICSLCFPDQSVDISQTVTVSLQLATRKLSENLRHFDCQISQDYKKQSDTAAIA